MVPIAHVSRFVFQSYYISKTFLLSLLSIICNATTTSQNTTLNTTASECVIPFPTSTISQPFTHIHNVRIPNPHHRANKTPHPHHHPPPRPWQHRRRIRLRVLRKPSQRQLLPHAHLPQLQMGLSMRFGPMGAVRRGRDASVVRHGVGAKAVS